MYPDKVTSMVLAPTSGGLVGIEVGVTTGGGVELGSITTLVGSTTGIAVYTCTQREMILITDKVHLHYRVREPNFKIPVYGK